MYVGNSKLSIDHEIFRALLSVHPGGYKIDCTQREAEIMIDGGSNFSDLNARKNKFTSILLELEIGNAKYIELADDVLEQTNETV